MSEGMSMEDMKNQIAFYKEQTNLLRAMGSPTVQNNLEGLKDVLSQPVTDFGEALLTPFREGLYAMASPLIAAAMPIMEDLAGTMGAALKPTFEAIAFLLEKAAPFIEAITSFLTTGITSLFTIEPGKPWSWEEATGGAAGGALTGGLIGLHFGGPLGAGIGAIIGGIAGFFFGGLF